MGELKALGLLRKKDSFRRDTDVSACRVGEGDKSQRGKHEHQDEVEDTRQGAGPGLATGKHEERVRLLFDAGMHAWCPHFCETHHSSCL